MEGDLLGLDLSVLDVDLVTDENDRDVLAYTDKILVPLGNILVGDAGAHIEHDDCAVSANAKERWNWLNQFSLWFIRLTSIRHGDLRASLGRRCPTR